MGGLGAAPDNLDGEAEVVALKSHHTATTTATPLLASTSIPHQNQPLLPIKTPDPHHRKGSRDDTEQKKWSPSVLRRRVLVAFGFFYVLVIVGLEIVLKECRRQHGFELAKVNLYYLWKYGPTAVLTLFAALWTQVDYRARQMQPWNELAGGPKLAKDGLLLDYISTAPLTALVQSLRRRHWPVSAALLGSFLLKVLIVVSTGLFSVQSLRRPLSAHLSLNGNFQFNRFDLAEVDDIAAALYAGALSKQIDFPTGTNAHYATEIFNTSKPISESAYSITANVSTFTADLACERAMLYGGLRTWCPPNSGCTTGVAKLSVKSKTCRVQTFPKDNSSLIVETNGTPYWYGNASLVTCDGSNGDAVDDRLIIYSFNMSSTSAILDSTALICKPSITGRRSLVTLDQSGLLKKVDNSTSTEMLWGVTSTELARAVLRTTHQLGTTRLLPTITSRQAFGNFFQLMLDSQHANTILDVLDDDLLLKGCRAVFEGVAVQIAKRYGLNMLPSKSAPSLQGTIEYDQQRLFVQLAALRWMESMLGGLILVAAYLAYNPARSLTPQDPVSIARLASLLSQSRGVMQNLTPTGSWSSRNLKILLGGKYGTRFDPDSEWTRQSRPLFTIEHKGVQGGKPNILKEEVYWTPIVTSWPVRAALPAIPLCLIIALEVLLRTSDHYNGLLTINPSKHTQLGSSFVPALVMVATKMLFSAADLNLRILDPFVQLRNGAALPRSSIHNKGIFTWKTTALWEALVTKRAAVSASLLSMVMASFLTIAVSGLYDVEQVTRQASVNLTRLDGFFNPVVITTNAEGNLIDPVIPYSAALAARLVTTGQMSSPLWTSGSYVLPHLGLRGSVTNGNDTPSEVLAHIPVQEGHIDCNLVATDQITANYSNGFYEITWPSVTPNCTGFVWSGQASVPVVGSIQDGLWARWNNFHSAGPGSDCPSSWAVWGRSKGNHVTEINAITCRASIQQMRASARFSLPGWNVNSLVVDHKSRQNISDAQETQLSLGFYIFYYTANDVGNIDNVFQAFLRNATTNVLDTSLLESANYEKLYERIQGVYSLAYAQFLNGGGRNANISEKPIIPATATISKFIPVVPKNPCSIAAQASLVAGSSMMAGLPPEAQWMDDKEFEALFKGHRYSMGWSSGNDGKGRYCIDVSEAIRPMERKRRWDFLTLFKSKKAVTQDAATER
ncbi:hypothetical protein H2200_000755 [Cladophialophora chaetospira]|uniref:Uncharacterized protein n=1 Tax=Cladophialophora chaetospira TaxID=386627 RepID=A0AA39CPG4_9EURO|nr:hypothetical protein H2200_000755 [Cladophialophora chaetospira]